MFQIVHSDNNNTQAGYAAVDSIMFDYSPDNECEVLPPDAIVKPTAPPGSEPADADFEQDWCGWSEDSGLNSEENFVWNRTTGAQQDGVNGPQLDYDSTDSSKLNITLGIIIQIILFQGHFMWAAGTKGTAEMKTALVSPLWSSIMNYCFTFWFDLTVDKIA